jgi:hypothetical protein
MAQYEGDVQGGSDLAALLKELRERARAGLVKDVPEPGSESEHRLFVWALAALAAGKKAELPELEKLRKDVLGALRRVEWKPVVAAAVVTQASAQEADAINVLLLRLQLPGGDKAVERGAKLAGERGSLIGKARDLHDQGKWADVLSLTAFSIVRSHSNPTHFQLCAHALAKIGMHKEARMVAVYAAKAHPTNSGVSALLGELRLT